MYRKGKQGINKNDLCKQIKDARCYETIELLLTKPHRISQFDGSPRQIRGERKSWECTIGFYLFLMLAFCGEINVCGITKTKELHHE